MQWILAVMGLVVGFWLETSLAGAVVGLVCGWGLGSWLVLRKLREDHAALRNYLAALSKQISTDIGALNTRVGQLEQQAEADADPAGETPVGAPQADAAALAAVAPAPEAATAPPAAPIPVAVHAPSGGAHRPTPAEPARAPDYAQAAMPGYPTTLTAAASVPTRPAQAPILAGEPASPAPSAPQDFMDAMDLGKAPAAASAPAVVAGPPQPPAAPAGPSWLQRAFTGARDWLLGGNTVLRVGAVLLFLGLAFLLRYATEGVEVPVEMRYVSVALSAMALLGLGWWLRVRRPAYGLVLQGTGIAVLYLTVFAAMRLHPLLDTGTGMALLVVITVCAAVLAVMQDALGLAAAAVLGGFAAPILASSGSGNHVALFAYLALLNAGIFAIAWFKAWRLLNLIGFVGTFGIGLAWGLSSYTPALFASTQAFLVLFFLMYVAIGLLFARRKLLEAADAPAPAARGALLRWSARQGDYVDGTVLFGPPLVGFGLQYAVVSHVPFGAAFSALVLGLFYLTLAMVLARRAPARAVLLMETCLTLGVVFGTLAIPLGLDARWTSAIWAVEGAALYWLGMRQQRPLARAFALLLQAGAALAWLATLRLSTDTLLAGSALGAAMLGASLLVSHGVLLRADRSRLHRLEAALVVPLGCAGLAFLYLIAPLLLQAQGTAIAWALAGLATLMAALRLRVRSFLGMAFAVQLLGGVVFLVQMDGALLGRGGLAAGWSGLLAAMVVGMSLVAAMVLAARDEGVRRDARLTAGLSVVLLLGLAFLNLAVLFVLPWRVASGVWAATGLLVLWLGLRLQLKPAWAFGLFLQVAGALGFVWSMIETLGSVTDPALRPLAHAGFWTPAVLALAALAGAWRLHREGRALPEAPPASAAAGGVADDAAVAHESAWFARTVFEGLSRSLLAWGAAWWGFALVGEAVRVMAPGHAAPIVLLAVAASVVACAWLAQRRTWPALAVASLAAAPVGLVAVAASASMNWHPAAHWGWLAWPVLVAAHLFALRRAPSEEVFARIITAAHVLGCWLVLLVLSWELRYLLLALSDAASAWRWLGWALVPSVYLVLAASPRRFPWPVAAQPQAYRVLAALPVAAAMLGWFWLANIASSGLAAPLPYVPLINPLELGLLLALAGVVLWLRQYGPQRWPGARMVPQLVGGVSLFALLTAAVMRTAHHWADVPYRLDALLGSTLVQAGLSIVWTLVALGLMIGGHRRAWRACWLVGAALIAVVVTKLFFVELGSSSGLARIVSFIGVGVLLLIVGYFAPLPPRRAVGEEAS